MLGMALIANAQDYTTSVYALDMNDRYVVCQVYVAPVVTIREEKSAHQKLMDTYQEITESYRRSTAELEAQSARWELERQTRELEEQTRLLRKIADK